MAHQRSTASATAGENGYDGIRRGPARMRTPKRAVSSGRPSGSFRSCWAASTPVGSAGRKRPRCRRTRCPRQCRGCPCSSPSSGRTSLGRRQPGRRRQSSPREGSFRGFALFSAIRSEGSWSVQRSASCSSCGPTGAARRRRRAGSAGVAANLVTALALSASDAHPPAMQCRRVEPS